MGPGDYKDSNSVLSVFNVTTQTTLRSLLQNLQLSNFTDCCFNYLEQNIFSLDESGNFAFGVCGGFFSRAAVHKYIQITRVH